MAVFLSLISSISSYMEDKEMALRPQLLRYQRVWSLALFQVVPYKVVVDLITASVMMVPLTGGTTRPRQRAVTPLSTVLTGMSKSAEARRDYA